MAMMRFCPNCQTERSLHEIFCEGVIEDKGCGWDLSNEPIRESGWRPALVVTAEQIEQQEPVTHTPHCINGHVMDEGDFICMTCGADLAEDNLETQQEPQADAEEPIEEQTASETQIDDWRLLHEISSTDGVRVRYLAEREEDSKRAVLTLYRMGAEPEPAVYEVIKNLPREHVPEIISTGRWNGQAYVVAEELTGGTLADIGIVVEDLAAVRHIVAELGEALNSFAEVGLRHCDLRPATLLVRSQQPFLDLVITGFGSARLSEFDLEIISPLQTTCYMSPETIAGGVSVASDWWSLGVILLEQLTRGECFKDINPQAFLIHVLTNGVIIPDNLAPSLQLLLRGLLARDHYQRWQWSQVKAWLNGEAVDAPESGHQELDDQSGITINLAGKSFRKPTLFALAAADVNNWQEACHLLLRGGLVTWLSQIEFAEQSIAYLREVIRHPQLEDDFRLMLALKLLNPEIPLITRGEIVTSGWLIQHPLEGYKLIDGFVPNLLEKLQTESWLWRLQERANTVRKRAKNLRITLNEEILKIHLLSTSRAQLAAQWDERSQIFPDASHGGLLSLTERRAISEEDLIVLLSADLGQFKSVDKVIEEATALAKQYDVDSLVEEDIKEQLAKPRLELYQLLNERIEGFARTGHPQIDDWTDQYRLEKRMPLARLLLLLSIPAEQWMFPQEQQYISQLLDYFHKKVTVSVLRGPLVRMQMGKLSTRIDLTLLNSTRKPATQLLDHILGRATKVFRLDPTQLAIDRSIESRLNSLYRKSQLYKRDTGIDSLYLGFPFLLYQEPDAYRLPRIAPVFLWPVKLTYESGLRDQVSLSFDSEREEVRINPALETMLGKELLQAWQNTIDELLARSALTATEVMDALSFLGESLNKTLEPLNVDVDLPKGKIQFACSAVLFDVSFIGQAVGEDLRQLKQRSPATTALETALRLNNEQESEQLIEKPVETDCYFTVASDPSQEKAVFQARQAPGLLVEGPPGTGKSQTIVNMVADAIGRGKTLLIVCQKKAALEVVHKRLVAEGMAQRCVMINDVNADRNAIISSVRDQLNILQGTESSDDWKLARERVASRIMLLEGRLDNYHKALHQLDEQSGLTYRQLVGELITLNKQHTAINAPLLRASLSPLTQQAVVALEEECAPIIRHWLPAYYEESPLAKLQAFSHDPAMIESFNEIFEGFTESEQQRLKTIEQNPVGFDLPETSAYQTWLNTGAREFLKIPEELRGKLKKWLVLFINNKEGEQLLSRLATLHQQLLNTSASAWYELSPKLNELPDVELETLIDQAKLIVMPAPWYSFLSVKRFKAKRRLFAFLKKQGDKATVVRITPLYPALLLEQRFRPIRQELQAICERLQLPLASNGIGSNMLLIEDVVSQLKQVQPWAAKLAITPSPKEIEQALLMGSDALIKLTSDYRAVCNRHDARVAGLKKLGLLKDYFGENLYEACEVAIIQHSDTPRVVVAIRKTLPSLAAYQYFRKRASQLSTTALQLLKRLRNYQTQLEQIPASTLDSYFRKMLNHEVRLVWKERLEQTYPELLLNYEETQRHIKDLAEADKQMRDLNRVLLEQNIPVTQLAKRRDWEDITRLTGGRAKRLREFIEQGEKLGLMKLRPVWLMNPDVASRVLPLKSGLFDMVVYDEASQMPIEYALPTLFRGKIMVVSGDEKQMPPSSFFSAQVEVDEEESPDLNLSYNELSEDEQQSLDSNWNRREIMDCPDLLQLARSVLPSTTLQIHYRSKYRELINYSNAAFYGDRLNVPVRHPLETIRQVKPIEMLQVNGVYQEQTNQQEAERIVELVADLWQQPKEQRPSLGVVTFNKKQADLIADLFDLRASQDSDFAKAFHQESQRFESGENMSVFIKNVENVQGDERDIILFSTTFGRNEQGIFRRNFGVLGQKGGERRLNVAITRAREKVVLVTSMPINDISDMFSAQRQPYTPRDYLQCYLEYARIVSSGDFASSATLLKRVITIPERKQIAGLAIQDGFVEDVDAFIRSLNVNYTKAQGNDAFTLDFAIENPRTNLYVFGVECDAPINSLLANARAREIWRPSVLKRSIPHVYRISSQAWYENSEQIKQHLKEAITKVLETDVLGASV